MIDFAESEGRGRAPREARLEEWKVKLSDGEYYELLHGEDSGAGDEGMVLFSFLLTHNFFLSFPD